mmetsp:Transcript_16728/g.15087  ORF Transcript_16728/g.15087 Transcript_16728/m.15087 type:complete len:182 (+) Transcript_16728:35-580(+)
MTTISTMFGYCLVGILWGCTNPFIKHAQNIINQKKKLQSTNLQITPNSTAIINDSKKITHVNNKSSLASPSNDQENGITHTTNKNKPITKSYFQLIKVLFTEPTVYLPFLINQSGSLVFYVVLFREPISIAAPVCNSLTFIFTAVTGYVVFKEEVQSPSLLIIGIILVLIGIYICMTNQKE